MNYTLTTYKGRPAIFCATSRCFVLFGARKALEKRLAELNAPESRTAARVRA